MHFFVIPFLENQRKTLPMRLSWRVRIQTSNLFFKNLDATSAVKVPIKNPKIKLLTLRIDNKFFALEKGLGVRRDSAEININGSLLRILDQGFMAFSKKVP